jgi:hypothetical protein
MTRNKFDIYFCAPDSFEDKLFEDSYKLLSHKNLNLTIEAKEPQAYASLEWAVPGLIVAYLAKPYFEGFLQEAGKDHYQVVKNWIKTLLRAAKEMSVKIFTSGKHKFDKKYSQSIIISIHFEIKNGQQVKLLFANELSIDDWESAIDKFSILIEDNYKNSPDDNLSKRTSHLRQEKYSTIYGMISVTNKEWEFFDDNLLIEIQNKIPLDTKNSSPEETQDN